MESLLSLLRTHWDHEPDWHPSSCPLPARRGEGGRRPGEGRFMESPLSFFACIGTMNHPPHPPSGHPLPLRGGEGWGEGAVHGEGQDEGEPTIVLIPLINCSSRRPYSTKFLLVSASEALELASWKTTTMCGSMEMPPS